jgi:hypothetical protein
MQGCEEVDRHTRSYAIAATPGRRERSLCSSRSLVLFPRALKLAGDRRATGFGQHQLYPSSIGAFAKNMRLRAPRAKQCRFFGIMGRFC